ncbi:hypothetical protein [Desertibaculum subflavum]|uniref:hypothetical protein n=1 Tax=Desertibaculum subflavum TaxID=2268458 RepID=UPI000E672B7E
MASDADTDLCPGGPSFRAQRFAAQFAIWATRIWVAAVKRHESPSPMLDQAFAAAGAAPALPHLHGLLRTLATAASRQIDIRCPNCTSVSPDEAALIQLIDAFQRGAFGEAAMLLSDWLPPAAVRLAIDQASALAAALAEADLGMSMRDASTARAGGAPAALRLH